MGKGDKPVNRQKKAVCFYVRVYIRMVSFAAFPALSTLLWNDPPKALLLIVGPTI